VPTAKAETPLGSSFSFSSCSFIRGLVACGPAALRQWGEFRVTASD
jgi:hypothetical protein